MSANTENCIRYIAINNKYQSLQLCILLTAAIFLTKLFPALYRLFTCKR